MSGLDALAGEIGEEGDDCGEWCIEESEGIATDVTIYGTDRSTGTLDTPLIYCYI
jgi:hypothetical protein